MRDISRKNFFLKLLGCATGVAMVPHVPVFLSGPGEIIRGDQIISSLTANEITTGTISVPPQMLLAPECPPVNSTRSKL